MQNTLCKPVLRKYFHGFLIANRVDASRMLVTKLTLNKTFTLYLFKTSFISCELEAILQRQAWVIISIFKVILFKDMYHMVDRNTFVSRCMKETLSKTENGKERGPEWWRSGRVFALHMV